MKKCDVIALALLSLSSLFNLVVSRVFRTFNLRKHASVVSQ